MPDRETPVEAARNLWINLHDELPPSHTDIRTDQDAIDLANTLIQHGASLLSTFATQYVIRLKEED